MRARTKVGAVLGTSAALLFAVAFFLSGLFAPNRSTRTALLAAAAIESVSFARVAIVWLHPFPP